MKVERVVCGEYRCNTYLVIENNEAILIDASIGVEKLKKMLEENNAILKAIFITHAHFDHILTLNDLMKAFNVDIFVGENGYEYLFDLNKNLSYMMTPSFEIEKNDKIKKVKDGDKIKCFENLEIEFFETEGHCKSSVCYKLGNIMFTGDTVFANTFGRVDLWNSSLESMKKSLIKISKIDGVDKYYPGHGFSFDKNNMLQTVEMSKKYS